MDAHKLTNVTIEEYLEIERETQTKYEYHNGSIYALAGGTLNHTKICGNIFYELKDKLKNTSCGALSGEAKIYIKSQNKFVYPDTIAVCGEIKTSKKENNSITNPKVIVEVLSKSTASYDRGDKFHMYRQIESLEEYVLIEQEKPIVEIYKRKGDLWQITRVEGLENEIHLTALDLKIQLQEIYDDVKFAQTKFNK